jgi:hypothetical protein
MPDKRPSVKNERQYEALKDKGMSKERAARIANSPGVSSRGGKKSGSGGNSKQGGRPRRRRRQGARGQGLSAEEAIEVERLVRQPSRIRSALSRSCGYAEAGAGPTYSEAARSGPTTNGTRYC